MKKVVRIFILSSRVLVFLFIFIGIILCLAEKPDFHRIKLDGKSFVDKYIPRILDSWNSEVLIEQADKEFLKSSPVPVIKKYMETLANHFGPFKGCSNSDGIIKDYTVEAKNVLAEYTANCSFEESDSQVAMVVTRKENQWKIISFFLRW